MVLKKFISAGIVWGFLSGWLIRLILTILITIFYFRLQGKTSLLCYSEKTGPKYQICDNSFGFQTCFTKYDASKKDNIIDIFENISSFSGKEIVLRGCSSKRKMFHIECESHLSGTRNEQFCYCGYDLCNGATSEWGNGKTLLTVILLSVCLRTFIHLWQVYLNMFIFD